MRKSKASFSHMGNSIITASFVNTVGYLGTSMFAGGTAAAVGGIGSMIAVSAVGAAALYIPTMLLRNALEEVDLMNSFISATISYSYFLGSAALGAVILGLAIQPVVACALFGAVVGVCYDYLNAPEAPKKTIINNRNHTFNVAQEIRVEPVERHEYRDEEHGYTVSEPL